MKTPEPLYPCSIELCREQFSFPAEDLFWVEKRQQWVCFNCFDHEFDLGIEDRGISLAERLKQTVAVVPREPLQKLVAEMNSGPAEFQKLINDHFWELCETEEVQ